MIKTKPFKPGKFELFKVSMVSHFKSILWYLSLIWFFAIFFMLNSKENSFRLFFLAFAIVFPIVIAVRYWIKYSSKEYEKLLIERYYEIDEEKIVVKYSDGTEITINNNTILKYTDSKKYCMLFTTIAKYLYIPYYVFESSENLDWIRNELFIKINKNGFALSQPINSISNKQSKKEAPTVIYLLCILFIIPLIGGFVGLVILMLGIFEYRNKIVIGLGALGILITVAVYTSLSYFGFEKRGGTFDKLTENLSQTFSTNLVKEIELYKITYGHYPLNLEQLNLKNSMTSVDDPILSKISKKEDNRNFYYQVVDSGYYIFSVGFDKTPFTKDDVFPKLSPEELKKFGYRQPTTK